MSTWMQIVLSVCAVALAVVLIPAIIAARRALQRLETVLVLFERELGPLAAQVQGLTEDLRTVTRQANRELERFGGAAERLGDLSERIARLVNTVSGVTRVGQIIGAATGIRKGLSVFLHRVRKQGGNYDG
jgi:uncharacterized protein YoxC